MNHVAHEYKMTKDEDHLRCYEKLALKFTMKFNQDFSPKMLVIIVIEQKKMWNHTLWH